MNAAAAIRSRLTRPVFLWALTALVAQTAVERLANPSLTFTLRASLALLPVIPTLGFVLALNVAIQRMDEMQKRICVDAVFIAFMIMLVVTFIADGLKNAGLYNAPADGCGTLMMSLFALTYIGVAWKYR